MSVSEKVLVYPFDMEFSPILRHKGLLQNYEISALISPNGWGMTGKDAGLADGGRDVGITVECEFEKWLDSSDTVLFSNTHTYIDFMKLIYPKINKAIERGKNIICTLWINENIRRELEERCSEKGVRFSYLHSRGALDAQERVYTERLFQIQTPVVLVAGVSERVHKFEIQLALREYFLNAGYKISQIGSRNYCELLGFHSFPGFMFDSAISESSKIILFNNYVKHMEDVEQPDVIIIGIPGGIMPFNDIITNNFGITAYEVSHAITPDAVVLSTLYEEYLPEYFTKMSASMPHKLGFEVDCYNLSNILFDWNGARDTGVPKYSLTRSSLVDKKKMQFEAIDTPVYNILNPDDKKDMAEHLVAKLARYAETGAV